VSFEVVLPVYERRFEHVPITAIGASRVQLLPPVVDVVVRGEPVVIDRMTPAQVVPVVDLTAVAPSRGAMSVPVELRPLPAGVTVGAREPTEVLVTPQR
jgi:hypothetical protein